MKIKRKKIRAQQGGENPTTNWNFPWDNVKIVVTNG
jgi:hypothetical protein